MTFHHHPARLRREFEGHFEFKNVEVQPPGWRLYGLSFRLRAFSLEHSPPDEIPAFALV